MSNEAVFPSVVPFWDEAEPVDVQVGPPCERYGPIVLPCASSFSRYSEIFSGFSLVDGMLCDADWREWLRLMPTLKPSRRPSQM